MAEEATTFGTPTNINWQGSTGIVEYGGGDKSMVVMFYNKPMHHPGKSMEAGRPVFEDKIHVRIHPPGERLNIVDRPAEDQHKRRYPMQWAQFQQQKQQIPEGTPIDMLYPEHPSIAATLRASAVHTVEQCADLSAHAIESIGMGAQRYVNAAQQYLKMANKGVGVGQMRKELEERDQQIKLLTRQVAEQREQLNKLIEIRTTGQVPTLEDIQKALVQTMQRPQHVASQSFDPQVAQINATHGAVTSKKGVGRQRARLRA